MKKTIPHLVYWLFIGFFISSCNVELSVDSHFAPGVIIEPPFSCAQLQIDSSWTPNYSDITLYYSFDGQTPGVSPVHLSNLVSDIGGLNSVVTNANGANMIYETGKYSTGMGFGGVDPDGLYITHDPTIAQDNIKSFQVWIKKNGDATGSTYAYALRKGTTWNSNAMSLKIGNGNPSTVQFVMAAPNIASEVAAIGTITEGEFFHLVGVIDATHIHLYINGSLAQSTPYTVLPNNDVGPFYIGSSAGFYRLNGIADEVVVWSTALTPTQVLNLYRCQ